MSNISNYVSAPLNAITSDINFLLFSEVGSQIVQLFGVVDLIPEELHEISVGKSNYPIETGATLTDHVFIKPKKLTIVGYVSDIMHRKITTLVTPFRDREAWERIKLIVNKREVVSVVTLLSVYNNMIITDVSSPKNSEVGKRSLMFRMTLEESLIAETQTTKLPKDKIKGAAKNKASLVNGGLKQSITANNSLLGQIIQEFSGG
jgi:hypothetical protein